MIKVKSHGLRREITNPADGSKRVTIPVTFIEEGRSGAVGSLSRTNDFLSQLTGKPVGLNQLRIHTQSIPEEQIGDYPVDKVFDQGHINRILYSFPQMRQQGNVEARMIDGKPTYIVTEIGGVAVEDKDERVTTETLAQISPETIRNARVGVAEVRTLTNEGAPAPGALTNERVRA